jgi:sugar phosphate isomerase/epimerase
MNILFHTIAIEPARWTPQRVSQPLTELLPHIAKAGFRDIEIYEPHLTAETVSREIKDALAANGLNPVILSSYLSLNPAVTTDAQAGEKIAQIAERIAFYGFKKLRLFPGPGMNPADADGVAAYIARTKALVARLPDTEILLETHDGSLADDPATVVRIVQEIAAPNVGLLFQATNFPKPETIMPQFHVEKPFIRHLHLQNRMTDGSFVRLNEGVILWPQILKELGDTVDATLEFVPVGICPVGQFDLAATIKQAVDEADYVRALVADIAK